MSNPERVNNHNSSGTLEARLVAALQDPAITAAQLAALIADAEQGLVDATTIATRMEQIALDPLQSPDLVKAREAAEFATFVVKRLNNTLPRLRSKYQEVAAQERRIRWDQAADVVHGERDAMAQEFAATYSDLIATLVDLFERLRVTDTNIDRINGAAPNSESRRVSPIGHQQILTTTKLLAPEGQQIWPPVAAPVLPQDVMPALPPMPRDWHQAISERNRARNAEAERVSNFYAQQARAREDRENAEAKAARQRGSP